MQVLVLIHSGGGSMVEGADAQATLGPYPNQKKADAVEEEFYDLVKGNDFLRTECWCTTVKVPDPPNTDVGKVAQEMIDDYGP